MTPSRFKAVVVFVLMLAGFGVATAWRPTAHLADQREKVELETMFPRSFSDWTVDDRMPAQLVSPDTAALLNKIYSQTLSRTYVNSGGERIMLSVAYGGDQSDATRAHRPEVCYPAQGFQLLNSTEGSVSTAAHQIRVRRLVARLGARSEPITYWIVVGEKVTITGPEQKLAQLSYSMRGVIPDGMLVRVSSIDPDAAAGFRLQEAFIVNMVKAISPAAKPQIVGLGGA